MTKDITLSVRIDRKVSNKLEKLARQAKRSKSAIAIFAIETYLNVQDQKREVAKHRLLDDLAAAPDGSKRSKPEGKA